MIVTVRADRLVAILMMLQTRGQVTAGEVAQELEVSERTARRDLDALGMAGLPIYSVQGRGGGWRLLGDGTTDLSALTSAEAQALFLVAGPASPAAPELKSALRKLVRALPEPFRAEAIAASTAVVVEPHGWDNRVPERPPPPHLDDVQRAVVTGRQVRLGYVARDRSEIDAHRPPAGHRRQGPDLVPRRRHRGRAAHVPRRPDGGGRAARRGGRASGRASSCRPRGG